jgi:hypothetical protein
LLPAAVRRSRERSKHSCPFRRWYSIPSR